MQALVQGASRGIGLSLVQALLESDPTHQVIATSRDPDSVEAFADLAGRFGDRLLTARLDPSDEASIEYAAAFVASHRERLDLLVNCAGVLHDGPDLQPEKRLEALGQAALRRSFDVNAIGPALVARHFFPLLKHGERAVLANLSARVGSISDNRAGGWYGYRASKAALNMLTKTLAIELGRRAPQLICVALHPGTVATDLSEPFRSRAKPSSVHSSAQAAEHLLEVIRGLEPSDSGEFFAWDGSPIPW